MANKRDNPLRTLLPSAAGLALIAGAAVLVVVGWEYYATAFAARSSSPLHGRLAPGSLTGLATGFLALALFVFNLSYLLRKLIPSRKLDDFLGRWLNWHVASGLLGGGYVAIHAGFRVRSEVTWVAVGMLVTALVTGVIGRYLMRLAPHGGDQARFEAIVTALGQLGDHATGPARQATEATLQRVRSLSWSNPGSRLLADELRATADELEAIGLGGGVGPEGAVALDEARSLALDASRQASHARRAGAIVDTWRPLHRVCAIAFVVASLVHIIWAIQRGYLRLS